MLYFVVTNREATYVLVFVEDVERFDGRHDVVKAVVESSLHPNAEMKICTLRNTREVGSKGVLLGVDLSRT